jgi:hypothetical protein
MTAEIGPRIRRPAKNANPTVLPPIRAGEARQTRLSPATPGEGDNPEGANTKAAVTRMAVTGSLSTIRSPMRTAGMFASIMPSVVPITTG